MQKEFVKRQSGNPSKALINKISSEHKISKTVAEVLLNRMDPYDIDNYLNPNFQNLHDPFLFNDMQLAVDRIKQAIIRNEHIVVWGDFDCDGVSGTSILMLELSRSTSNISYYIPNRIKEGYGVNKEGIKKLYKERGVSLIITVDCGITSMEEVEFAKSLGIDMIITDHHRADKGRPDAYAVINPKVEGEQYPFDGLCGAAVASKLAQGLYGIESLMRTIDIVAMATVADLVPLKDENRVFVNKGLQAINYMQRPAIQEMSKFALKKEGEVIKAHHFGFRYGPMINASGRIGNAEDAVELFITNDSDKRKYLANKLYEYNNTRKARESLIIKEVEEKISTSLIKNTIVVYGEGWEPGIVGIVASRILEKYYRPTIILTYMPEQGVYKGSGRSIEGVDLYDALYKNERFLGNWGGHAEAAGLEVKPEYIDDFIRSFEDYISNNYKSDIFIPKVKYDIDVKLSDINMELINEINRMEPFGLGNPSVSFRAQNLNAYSIQKMGKENEHFSAQYSDNTSSIKGVSFYKEPPLINNNLEVIFKPNINEFMGNISLQLIVSEIKEKNSLSTDSKSINKKSFNDEQSFNNTQSDSDNNQLLNTLPNEEETINNLYTPLKNLNDINYKKDLWDSVSFGQKPIEIPIEDFISSKAKIGQFKKAGIETNIDLINYKPRRFYDLTKTHTVDDVIKNNLHDEIINIVLFIKSISTRGSHVFANAVDANGADVSIAWFNQYYIAGLIYSQQYISVSGKLDVYNPFKPQIVPIYYTHDIEKSKIILPEYKKIKGMSDEYLKNSIKEAFKLTPQTDFLEKELVLKYNLRPEINALYGIHFPNTINDIKEGAKRDIFNILFKFNFKLKHANIGNDKVNKFKIKKIDLVEKLKSKLPFELTKDQDKAVKESIQLMNGKYPLQGLVQGDVGSGKTIVSILLMLASVNNGYQATMIAPTEVLAKQHYEELKELMKDFEIEVGYLSGGLKAKERREVLKGIKDGSIKMVVGTHAVLQDSVEFNDLGLVVIDEQHRFGVEQREKLKRKDKTPHIILMSATPIPRTLSMSIYGDNLKVFNIKTMPSGRLPIKTEIIMNDEGVYNFMYSELQKGRQAYVVCPLIEESNSDKMKDIKSLEVEFEEIKDFFKFDPNVKIAMISGKMKQQEINNIVNEFEKGNIHVLLSTTIIEVGVNVPNASVMVIKSSDRFGLAQLHQLRGRVGRGIHQSYCVLQPSKEDIKANIIKSTTDGFRIAEEDLKLRGHGNLIGTEQSGSFKEIDIMINNPEIYDKINKENSLIFKDFERMNIYDWIIR